jgi:hypothetical protein
MKELGWLSHVMLLIHQQWCFSFGGGSYIILSSNSHLCDNSHSNFPHSYKGKKTFTGASTLVM